EPRTGGETSPAQHLARVEPRLRIILVWVRGEAGERYEIRGRPFPHIADHLPASEGAVAGGAGSDIERVVEGEIEVGAFAAPPRPRASGACDRPSGSRPRSLRRQPPLPIRPRSGAGAWPSCTRLAPRTN